MKNKFLTAFLFLSILVFSQKKYQKLYFDNGELKQEGWLKNNTKIDYWVFYYSNGKIREKGHYKNGLKHKYWYFYRDNSIKQKEGHYINGIQSNWWTFFDQNGDLEHKCQLQNDKKNGYCLIYQKNKLVKALKFINDKKVKEWKDFSSFKKENNLNDLK